MLILYQREGCPYCKPVRQLLTDLGIDYYIKNLPKPRENRTELIKKTGVPYIPAIEDDGVVIPGRLEDNSKIIDYLKNKYR